MNPKKLGLRPGVEILEDRTVPSGDVLAFIDGQSLHVIGSQQVDNFQIIRDRLSELGPVAVIIEGRNGTTINGQQSIAIVDVISRIEIETKNGDDRVDITYRNPGPSINILTGNGNDTVNVYFGPGNILSLPGLAIDTGNGNDAVSVTYASLSSPQQMNGLAISTGSGNDSLTLSGDLLQTTLLSPPQIRLGDGDDLLNCQLTGRYNGSFEVDGGEGVDRLINSDYFTYPDGYPMYMNFEFTE